MLVRFLRCYPCGAVRTLQFSLCQRDVRQSHLVAHFVLHFLARLLEKPQILRQSGGQSARQSGGHVTMRIAGADPCGLAWVGFRVWFFAVFSRKAALGKENNIGDLGNGSPTPCTGCYSATLPSPIVRNRDSGCYKRCYGALHRVLHFSPRLEAATSPALDYSAENSE